MTQYKRADAQGSAAVAITKPVHLDEDWEDLDAVRERIGTGQAFLKVVEYPWGVEFDVCDTEGSQ
jgi:hypothetical protein